MSGFLPDIASWALGGGANNSNNNTTNAEGTTATSNNNNDDNINNLPPVPMTPQELRDQRLARMALLQNQQQSTTAENNNNNSEDPVPMDIVPSSPSSDPASASRQQQQQQSSKTNNIHRSNTNNMPPNKTSNQKVKGPSPPTILTSAAAAAASSDTTNATTTTKRSTATTTLLQRKQESLLAKCLQVQLVGGTLHNNNSSALESTTVLDTGSVEISVTTIAEILALRLSLEPNTNKILAVAYLGAAYNRTTDELRTLTNSNISNSTNASKRVSSNSTSATHEALTELLMEIQKQTVSYAATCLLEPDVFPSMSIDVEIQWATALLKATSGSTAPEHNLTMGGTQSFYYLVMEELCQQQQQSNGVGAEEECSRQTVRRMVQYYMKTLLFQSESVLDSISVDGLSTASTAAANAGVGVIGPTVVVTALTAMAMHKSAALAMAELDSFLLPPAGTPEAVAQIRPPPASISNPLLQHFLGDTSQHRAYTARSGPGLEKSTLLGMVLRVGAPRTTENPAFPRHSILRQSLVSVESATRTQRQQLTSHQQACFQLVMALLKGGGTVARARLFTWFTDALLVNIGASGLRPDPAKVSSSDLLLNMQVMLLKLCDPFTGDHSKQHLIDAGFVSTPAAHGGVFCTTGEDAVPRLGSTDASVSIATYQPKNAFIPQCFFFCARSLHLSVVPLLQQHENLLRHISHWHYELSNSGRDLQSDPRFAALISRQRSEEVALFQEEMMEATLNFCNFTAKVLIDMNDETIASMPEEFVSDMCDVLLSMATLKPKLLAGHEFRFVFQLVVKFLSPKYASMVRNYNLRAQLGVILHDLFLPRGPGSRREVPVSVATDPLAGGQTYLLSDTCAQETLAPSLLLLYGEVEHTGYFDKMSHRAKIASLIKYLWESSEHRPAFRRITQNKTSFIKFANGIMNETNTLIATVMQKLPEIREAQEKMKNPEEWGRLSEDEQSQISSRLEDNERDVKSSLPLCNKTLQMFGYLNTDADIRNLFLLDELCSRLVTMLLHVLTKLVGAKGLDLKVDNPEQYDFRPKEMLRDLCAIFALFTSSISFQDECAKSGCDASLLRLAVKTCRRLTLLEGESMEAFASLPDAVEAANVRVAHDEELLVGAPEEFLDEILSTFMMDPIILPSGHYVDRSTISQHLLNDSIDPFNREPLTLDQIKPAVELKVRIVEWLEKKRAAREGSAS